MTGRVAMIMAGGTGGHIFSYDVTHASHALVCTEDLSHLIMGVSR